MKKLFSFLLLFASIGFLGCVSSKTTILKHYTDNSYKEQKLDPEEGPTSPLLIQYKFISPVEEHEILILDNAKKQYHIRIKDAQDSENGFIVRLPNNKLYAVASFYIYAEGKRKELQLGKSLPLFRLSKERLTRIKGFDIINDKDPAVNSISIASWDGMTENLLIIQASKKFQIPEKSIRTIDLFSGSR